MNSQRRSPHNAEAAGRRELRDCLDDFNGQPVTIDFSGVTFLDSSGLAVLIGRYSLVGPDSLVLRGVQPTQMKAFEITRLDEVLNFE